MRLSPTAAPLIATLILFAACSSNQPEGTIVDPGGTNDTTKHNVTDTLSPCKADLDTAIHKNGFTLNGDGFINQVVRIDPDRIHLGEVTSDGGDSTVTIALDGPAYDPIAGDSAQVAVNLIAIDIPGMTNAWAPDDPIRPTGIRIAYTKNGVTKVLKSVLGSTKVKYTKVGAYPFQGTFCGYFKDSVTNVQVAVNGQYFVD